MTRIPLDFFSIDRRCFVGSLSFPVSTFFFTSYALLRTCIWIWSEINFVDHLHWTIFDVKCFFSFILFRRSLFGYWCSPLSIAGSLCSFLVWRGLSISEIRLWTYSTVGSHLLDFQILSLLLYWSYCLASGIVLELKSPDSYIGNG